MTAIAVKMSIVGPCGQPVATQKSSTAVSAMKIRSASRIPGNGSGTEARVMPRTLHCTPGVLTTSSPFATV